MKHLPTARRRCSARRPNLLPSCSCSRGCPARTNPVAATNTTPGTLEEFGLTRERVPRHVAIIMDGNGRWAQSRRLPRIEGHRRGVKSVRTVVEACAELKAIDQLTLFCLSSENWKRPRRELDLLMSLLEQYVIEERSEIMRQDLRFTMIGRTEELNQGVLQEVERTVECSRDNRGMRLCLAVNYGSRAEMVDAIRDIAGDVANGELSPEDVDEDLVSSRLYTAGMSDPDLLIRTAGEMRVSNFLLWQISYAEIWVTQKYWPEFHRNDLLEALQDYASRERRFGGLTK
ncbi:MAG: di-trans,poly-cis-decaprenylcistransferase [Planctomycetaceae bacterium]|nr:di-trans,poly-cis-decaprenylcistransferase [Planctomycetaceae bacterium]